MQNEELAGNALRVLGMAYKYVENKPTNEEMEK